SDRCTALNSNHVKKLINKVWNKISADVDVKRIWVTNAGGASRTHLVKR
ncbi:unnamed protein product, partial [Allacma fusca]